VYSAAPSVVRHADATTNETVGERVKVVLVFDSKDADFGWVVYIVNVRFTQNNDNNERGLAPCTMRGRTTFGLVVDSRGTVVGETDQCVMRNACGRVFGPKSNKTTNSVRSGSSCDGFRRNFIFSILFTPRASTAEMLVRRWVPFPGSVKTLDRARVCPN